MSSFFLRLGPRGLAVVDCCSPDGAWRAAEQRRATVVRIGGATIADDDEEMILRRLSIWCFFCDFVDLLRCDVCFDIQHRVVIFVVSHFK